MARFDYGFFDVDNHYYETEEAFTRYLEPEFQGRFSAAFLLFGEEKQFGGGGDRKPGQEDWVLRPGSLKEYLRKLGSSEEGEGYGLMPALPGFRDRDERLKLMDQQGIEACTMFSTAVSTEHRIEDPNALYAHLRALNRWVEDEWGYAYQGRIFCPAAMSLRDLGMAVEELERVIREGARTINLRPGHAYGRSAGDPYFDPFWARINEARISVLFHQGEGGHNKALAPLWGYDPDAHVFKFSAWQWLNSYGDVAVMAALSQLIYDNIFGRYPNIKIASVENGAGWLPYWMSRIDKMRGMGRNGPWIGGQLEERPTEIARRHVVVTPYPEDDVASIVAAVGHEMLALGSDYPHAEGLAEPRDFQKMIDHLPADQQRWILRDNGFSLVAS